MYSVAVTGTNGKTSCTQWLGQALSRRDLPTTVVGTLGIGLFRRGSSGPFAATGFTTPDAVQLHRKLAAIGDRPFIDPTDRFSITGVGYGLDGEVHHAAGNTNTIEGAILPFLITNDADVKATDPDAKVIRTDAVES